MDESEVTKLLDAPTKWVGMYTATASAVCTLAMAADVIHGLRTKKLWFPCKYFSLNATSLTLLAVAMKPPMDLSDQLYKDAGYFTKVSSLTFLCTAMVNFMSSLGSMNDRAILTNTIALGILAVTIVGNIWIQVIQLLPYPYINFCYELFVPTIFVLVLLVTLVSSAIIVPNIKMSLEMKYQEMHKVTLREEHGIKRNEKFTIANQMEEMKKYWMMAVTSNPQFVMARSVVSTASSVICFLATFMLAAPALGIFSWMPLTGLIMLFRETRSAYKWSIKWIIAIQSIGVVVGAIAPTLRWFNNVHHKCSTVSYKSIGEGFHIENYWTQTLVDWRDNSLALQIRREKCLKFFHGAKWLILNICIVVQILIVLLSKLLIFLCVLLMTPFIACFTHIRKFFVFVSILLKILIRGSSRVINLHSHAGIELGDNIELSLNRYVLLLEGELELPETTLKRICHQADKVIETGKIQQPENLINFLHKSGDHLCGVREFDSVQVPSLHSQKPANCWSLPLVNLTAVAIALPNVANNNKAKQLLSCVKEGMSFAKLVDKTLDTSGELINLRKAADVTWTGVLLYRKWQDMDLQKTSFSCIKSKELLQNLSNKAESIVREFKREIKDFFMESPLYWPVRVVAANSMYRICQTVLFSIVGENDPTDEELFEQLCVMIADIFAACLTNLPHVISTMCHQSAIEKRENGVREAFLLLGKTEKILELLQQRELPSFNPGSKVLYIDEFQAFFHQGDENQTAFPSTSSNETVRNHLSREENLVVTVDC